MTEESLTKRNLPARRVSTDLEGHVDRERHDMGKRYIVAQMGPDNVKMYKGSNIPWVVKSTHPRYPVGTRFDYGFLQAALRQNYAVAILPPGVRLD